MSLKGIVSKSYGYAEINRIRERVVNAAKEENRKTIMISSPHDSAGNTFLVSVLGYSIAYFNNLKVLLADLNMRRPQLHLPFGLQQGKGFTDFAAESLKWKEAVKDTGLSELKVMTAGQPDERLPFFLNRPFLKDMVQEMKEEFDLVIFDTNPLLVHNRNNVDPIRLCILCDMVFIVVQDKMTTKRKLGDTINAVMNGGGKVDGIIYNRQY